MPLPGFVEALQKHAIPRQIGWYGYKGSLPQTRKIASEALKKHRGISFLPDDIFMTNGTVVGLAMCLKMLNKLQSKRDRMATELQNMGYELNIPQGTFFLLVKSPWDDDGAFAELLATNYQVFVLPGTPQEIPGYFRISLTANDEMITQALPKFKAAREEAIKKKN